MDWIEKLAREHGTGGWVTLDDLVHFGKVVAEQERDACAKICETAADNAWSTGEAKFGDLFARAIRERSNV